MLLPHLPLAVGFGNLFGVDGFVILILGLLIFGRRLPEVGKNLGKTIVEFKKGLAGTSEDKTASTFEEPAAEEPKRISTGTRVAASPPPRRRLPETEEV